MNELNPENLIIVSACPVCNQLVSTNQIVASEKGKDYKIWSSLKSEINNSESLRPLFHEREIWLCKLGENIGFEQDGKGSAFLRPILIIKKFNHEVLWAIPLTTTTKNSQYYFIFSFQEDIVSAAIISQIRLIDAKRLQNLIGYMKKEDFVEIKKKLKVLLP